MENALFNLEALDYDLLYMWTSQITLILLQKQEARATNHQENNASKEYEKQVFLQN